MKQAWLKHIALSRVVAFLGALTLLGTSPGSAAGQQYYFESGEEPGVEIGRWGTAIVIESQGPQLFGRREFYRPVPPLQLRNRWLVVQDSTFGLVFTEPSGVKPNLGRYDGDVYLRALVGVTAIEVRALVLNVWGELVGYLSVTVLAERQGGDTWDLHPRWPDEQGRTHEHRTSIIWINRVMFDDESILEADMGSVAAAWKHVTGSDFEGVPEGSLLRATGR